AVAFASVAREDVENARLMIRQLLKAQQVNDDKTKQLRYILAWRLMGKVYTHEQARWLYDD
ncbi:hypothetical protein ACVGXX_00645, partial [Enterobacter intestinihominis]